MASRLLDTGPEAAFDDLTRLAAVLIGAPLAFATVVDDVRSFWKSCFGIPEGAARQNAVEESFCQYVVRSRQELVVTDAAFDAVTCSNPSVQMMGVRAWAGFPLLAPGGEVLGSFCVVDTVPRSWSDRDLEILRTLADAAAREIALRGAVQEERNARSEAEALAKTLQEILLPPTLPDIPGIEVAARFHPAGSGAEVAGDFYDVFQSAADRWNFVIGDVCGKGVEAAKVASLARHTVGVAAMKVSTPKQILSWVNDSIRRQRHDEESFLTAICGTLTMESETCCVGFASAGHVPPVLRRLGGSAHTVESLGTLAGVWEEFGTEEIELRLWPGDAFVLYTDGITEARRNGGPLFGERALLQCIDSTDDSANAEILAQRIVAAALEHCDGTASDDIAVLVLRVPKQPD